MNRKACQLELLLAKSAELEGIEQFLASKDADIPQICSPKFEPCLRKIVLQILQSKQLFKLNTVFKMVNYLCAQDENKGIHKLLQFGLPKTFDSIFAKLSDRLLKDDHDELEDIELLENYLQTICSLVPLIKDNCTWFSASLTNLLKLVVQCYMDSTISFEILNNVNCMLSGMPKESSYIIREYFQSSEAAMYILKELVSNLAIAGDFETQCEVVEIIVRCLPSEKRRAVAMSFNKNKTILANLFLQISCQDFEKATRVYLMEVNRQAERCRVFSFPYHTIALGTEVSDHNEFTWIDFGFGSKKICFRRGDGGNEEASPCSFSITKKEFTNHSLTVGADEARLVLETEQPLIEYDDTLEADVDGQDIVIVFKNEHVQFEELVDVYNKFFEIPRKKQAVTSEKKEKRCDEKSLQSQIITSSQLNASQLNASQLNESQLNESKTSVQSFHCSQPAEGFLCIDTNSSKRSRSRGPSSAKSVESGSSAATTTRKISKCETINVAKGCESVGGRPPGGGRVRICKITSRVPADDGNASDTSSICSSKRSLVVEKGPKPPSRPATSFLPVTAQSKKQPQQQQKQKQQQEDVIPETQEKFLNNSFNSDVSSIKLSQRNRRRTTRKVRGTHVEEKKDDQTEEKTTEKKISKQRCNEAEEEMKENKREESPQVVRRRTPPKKEVATEGSQRRSSRKKKAQSPSVSTTTTPPQHDPTPQQRNEKVVKNKGSSRKEERVLKEVTNTAASKKHQQITPPKPPVNNQPKKGAAVTPRLTSAKKLKSGGSGGENHVFKTPRGRHMRMQERPSPSLTKITKENVAKQVNNAFNELRDSFSPKPKNIVKEQKEAESKSDANKKENQQVVEDEPYEADPVKVVSPVPEPTEQRATNIKKKTRETKSSGAKSKVSFSPSSVLHSPKGKQKKSKREKIFDSSDGYSSSATSVDHSWLRDHKRKCADADLGIVKEEKVKIQTYPGKKMSRRKGKYLYEGKPLQHATTTVKSHRTTRSKKRSPPHKEEIRKEEEEVESDDDDEEPQRVIPTTVKSHRSIRSKKRSPREEEIRTKEENVESDDMVQQKSFTKRNSPASTKSLASKITDDQSTTRKEEKEEEEEDAQVFADASDIEVERRKGEEISPVVTRRRSSLNHSSNNNEFLERSFVELIDDEEKLSEHEDVIDDLEHELADDSQITDRQTSISNIPVSQCTHISDLPTQLDRQQPTDEDRPFLETSATTKLEAEDEKISTKNRKQTNYETPDRSNEEKPSSKKRKQQAAHSKPRKMSRTRDQDEEESKRSSSKKKLNFESNNKTVSRRSRYRRSTSREDHSQVSKSRHRQFSSGEYEESTSSSGGKDSSSFRRRMGKLGNKVGKKRGMSSSSRHHKEEKIRNFTTDYRNQSFTSMEVYGEVLKRQTINQSICCKRIKQLQDGAENFLQVYQSQFKKVLQDSITSLNELRSAQSIFVDQQNELQTKYWKELGECSNIIEEEVKKNLQIHD